MASLRLFAVATALLAAQSAAVSTNSLSSRLQRIEASESIDPVKRVVSLLTTMQETLQKEMDEDETLYNKLVCWCNTNEYQKDDQIGASTSKIAELEDTIESLTAQSAGLTEKIAEVEKDFKDRKSALAEATAIREKEAAEFQAGKLDQTQALENLKAAIEVLSKHNGAAFPQISLSLISLKSSDEPSTDEATSSGFLQARDETWSPSEINTVKLAFKSASAFMQAHHQDNYYPSYNAQSGEIFGVLKQMEEEMTNDFNERNEREGQSSASFQELRSAAETEIAAGEKTAEQKEDKLATTNNDNAEAKEDLEIEVAALSDAQKFMKELKATCGTANKNFEERKKSRLDEIQAVSETIGILQADEARDNRTSTYSFVQIRAQSRIAHADRRRAAASVLRHTDSPELSMLASRVELDAFGKVKAAIDKMIADLKVQQSDEVKHKDYCDKSIQANEMSTAKNEDKKSDIEANIGTLESKIKTLEEEIEKTKAEQAAATVNLQRANEDRKQENADYQKTVADQTSVIEVLKKALDRLAKFYDDEAFLQKSKKVATVSKKRDDPTDPNAPDVAQKEYNPNQGASGVMQMIEKLVHEANKLVADSKKAENDAQASYESLIADTNAAIKGFMNKIVSKTGEKADANEDRLGAVSDHEDTTKELEGLAKANAEYHAECDFVLRNFDVRQTGRGEEIEALQQAKQILSGASLG